MKLTIYLISIFIYTSSYGQIKLTKVDSLSIPASLTYFGHVVNAVNWLDALGLNYVITTQIDAIQNKPASKEDNRDGSLYAYHYLFDSDHPELIWKVYDFNKECPVDLDLYFIDKTFAITDLDKNGIAEIWLMYRNGCHGDVSPIPTKIIMYEEKKKYALRGTSRVQISATKFMGGDFTFDKNFLTGNPLFRQYAEKLWAQHKDQKW